jgi:hypothetical protein
MTAVEQLEKRLKKCIAKQNPNDIIVLQLTKFTFERWFEQAKEMEKEQLKDRYLRGIENYDPTFKRQEQ